MSISQDNNKRIAKNTILLYFRMLFLMGISLYTSRVVLNTLGVEDYGIYNVVGGIVAMFGFINSSMASATQRFITFALGQENAKQLESVFGTTLLIHSIISFLVVILGETIGLWFLYNKMQIPESRMDAAFWVLQCSIVSTVILILSVPYNAAIIAHEKMSAFAYISILEVVLKLLIVYLLLCFSFDKLILYAVLLVAVQALIQVCYRLYCLRHFQETKVFCRWNKPLFKEMTGFAGWSLFGNLSAVCFNQGLNMLLNVFFGPIVNAARAIAVQVQNAILQFVSNFQMALNPQITKMYAQHKMDDMRTLMYRSARFSFYLLFLLSLPVLFETNYLLTLWLKTVPDNTVIFLRIMICTSLLNAVANPLIIANQATGKVRKYQAICGTLLLMILPISYVCLLLGYPAYAVFVVHFVIECVTQLARMILLRPLIGIRIKDYILYIYSRISIVTVVSLLFPLMVYNICSETGFIRFVLISLSCVLSVSVCTFFIGLTNSERLFFQTKFKEIILRK